MRGIYISQFDKIFSFGILYPTPAPMGEICHGGVRSAGPLFCAMGAMCRPCGVKNLKISNHPLKYHHFALCAWLLEPTSMNSMLNCTLLSVYTMSVNFLV